MKLNLLILSVIMTCQTNAEAAEDRLITNGNFAKKSLKPWKIFATEKLIKPTFSIANGEVTITSAKASPKQSNEQFTQQLEKLKSNTKYTFSFQAKAENVLKPLVVTLSRSKDWTKGHYGLFRKITPTNEWKDYKMTFTTIEIEEGNLPQLKFLFGEIQGKLSLRKIALIEVNKPIEIKFK